MVFAHFDLNGSGISRAVSVQPSLWEATTGVPFFIILTIVAIAYSFVLYFRCAQVDPTEMLGS
jgi:hypothetical protein